MMPVFLHVSYGVTSAISTKLVNPLSKITHMKNQKSFQVFYSKSMHMWLAQTGLILQTLSILRRLLI